MSFYFSRSCFFSSELLNTLTFPLKYPTCFSLLSSPDSSSTLSEPQLNHDFQRPRDCPLITGTLRNGVCGNSFLSFSSSSSQNFLQCLFEPAISLSLPSSSVSFFSFLECSSPSMRSLTVCKLLQPTDLYRVSGGTSSSTQKFNILSNRQLGIKTFIQDEPVHFPSIAKSALSASIFSYLAFF